jgi:hypothetical protein
LPAKGGHERLCKRVAGRRTTDEIAQISLRQRPYKKSKFRVNITTLITIWNDAVVKLDKKLKGAANYEERQEQRPDRGHC